MKFRFAAGTSRGVYNTKDTWILYVSGNGKTGMGECGPLPGLSIDNLNNIENKLDTIKEKLSSINTPENFKDAIQLASQLAGFEYPSIRFALESAFLDLLNGGRGVIFDNDFTNGNLKIPINGLVWMGDVDFMRKQIDEKPAKGYKCLKMKIGAISRNEELDLIKYVREKYPDIVLRLDANGAFDPDTALELLNKLKKFIIHSIEQPIKPGQRDAMKTLCRKSPIPIALDEELIGVNTIEEKLELLKGIIPQYVILKPSLMGGFAACNEWIAIAEKLNIGWWITSMLESNIGLNAIAQFTAEVNAKSFQGLGTGMLYENNVGRPLLIENGFLENTADTGSL